MATTAFQSFAGHSGASRASRRRSFGILAAGTRPAPILNARPTVLLILHKLMDTILCMRPRGASEELERRRRRAIGLLQKGQTYRGVAHILGASLSSVVRWFQAYKRGGFRSLRSKPTPGRPCRLSAGQKKSLARVLLRGAQAAGYSTELWTLRRIGEVIRRQFGVRYSISAIRRLLVVDMNWSTQKPERRATQRDEPTIAQWKRKEWVRIKKKRVGWAPTSLSSTKAAFS